MVSYWSVFSSIEIIDVVSIIIMRSCEGFLFDFVEDRTKGRFIACIFFFKSDMGLLDVFGWFVNVFAIPPIVFAGLN